MGYQSKGQIPGNPVDCEFSISITAWGNYLKCLADSLPSLLPGKEEGRTPDAEGQVQTLLSGDVEGS